jgi:hypothetical protein
MDRETLQSHATLMIPMIDHTDNPKFDFNPKSQKHIYRVTGYEQEQSIDFDTSITSH